MKEMGLETSSSLASYMYTNILKVTFTTLARLTLQKLDLKLVKFHFVSNTWQTVDFLLVLTT